MDRSGLSLLLCFHLNFQQIRKKGLCESRKWITIVKEKLDDSDQASLEPAPLSGHHLSRGTASASQVQLSLVNPSRDGLPLED